MKEKPKSVFDFIQKHEYTFARVGIGKVTYLPAWNMAWCSLYRAKCKCTWIPHEGKEGGTHIYSIFGCY